VVGTTVSLAPPTPEQPHWEFKEWSPSPCASSFVMPAQNLICTATFVLKKYSLNLSKSGKGTVIGTGINCGTDCTESYDAKTVVTLTATPEIN